MSHHKQIAIAVAVLVATGLCVAGSNRSAQPQGQSVDQRLLDLEATMAALEQRMAELETRVNTLTVAIWPERATPVPFGTPQAPPRAIPFQFNGMTFYHMPASANP